MKRLITILILSLLTGWRCWATASLTSDIAAAIAAGGGGTGITNTQTGVTLSGTFTNSSFYGNGGGLTNIPTSSVSNFLGSVTNVVVALTNGLGGGSSLLITNVVKTNQVYSCDIGGAGNTFTNSFFSYTTPKAGTYTLRTFLCVTLQTNGQNAALFPYYYSTDANSLTTQHSLMCAEAQQSYQNLGGDTAVWETGSYPFQDTTFHSASNAVISVYDNLQIQTGNHSYIKYNQSVYLYLDGYDP